MRLLILLAASVNLHIRQFLCLVAAFVLKQLVTIQYSLNHRMAVVLIMAGWNGFEQISPDMGVTTASPDIFQLVITTVTIRNSFQDADGMFSGTSL